ncbi:hypothetical protein SLEP1_g45385 [Rubroshorea leprosula]|uniref:Uncharacterized protein n=1 Tax=Rubroshorea leprosula TaxID=152421 RepID=A0AAV5LJ78_9ROSI|nr:hypothetical protein SLEP1_g45385 [Rubroshorea leprosula]
MIMRMYTSTYSLVLFATPKSLLNLNPDSPPRNRPPQKSIQNSSIPPISLIAIPRNP